MAKPVAPLILLCAILCSSAAEADRFSLSTLEGVVVSVQSIRDRDELILMAVELRDSESAREILITLAPTEACREIGFVVRPGDRLRAHVFQPEDRVAAAHNVLNLSRGTTTRFRTLTGVPLWDSTGSWQGGRSQFRPGNGPHGRRHRLRIRGADRGRPAGEGAEGD